MANHNAQAVREIGASMGEAIGIFMLHPDTFAAGMAVGFANPLAAYVAGRGGVLGEATGVTVAAVFAVFEPDFVAALWAKGIAVRGAVGAADLYWSQTADFGRKYLAGAEGLDRLAELAEKVIEATPGAGLPLYAGWRTMSLVDDAPGRAMQVMFVLRELRAAVHFNILTNSGITPVEAHMLNKGPSAGQAYARMFGWPEPFADGADKKKIYDLVEDSTNQRMSELLGAALDSSAIAELARLSVRALEALKAAVTR